MAKEEVKFEGRPQPNHHFSNLQDENEVQVVDTEGKPQI